MKDFIEQVKKRLGKKRMSLVEVIYDDDPEVLEVWLKEGFWQRQSQETMWVFGIHHLLQNGGYMTVKEMYDDLFNWFSYVEKGEDTYRAMYGKEYYA